MHEPETYTAAFAPRTLAGHIGKVLFRHRGLMPAPFILGTIATLILLGDTLSARGIPFGASVGGCVVLCGLGHLLRVWAIGHAGHETRRVRIAASRLATSGPFRYTRNPIYIGNLLIAIGLAFVSRTMWVTVVFPPLLFVQYHFIIRYEEEYLEHTFGKEYAAYRKGTPRYLGRSRASGPPAVSFERGETLRKEYQAVLATLSAAAAFIAARMLR